MNLRKITSTDRERMLTFFKPMFGNCDDLHTALPHLDYMEYLEKSGKKRKSKR